MKYFHIERFNATLTVLSPVFIGGGQDSSLNKKNTVFLPGKPYLLIPDEARLVTALSSMGLLDAYEAFLWSGVNNDLYSFLTEQGVPVREDAEWVAYSLECHESRINTLKLFIKLPDGTPYIPGSSVKGALRTALLASKMDKSSMQNLLQNAENNPRNRYQGDEEKLLRTLTLDIKHPYDAVNDQMRGISVSDSAPIGLGSLVVTNKKDMKYGSGMYREGKIPLLRECLKPGTAARLTISLDTSVFPLRCFDELKQALQKRDEVLQRCYYDLFQADTDDLFCPEGEYPLSLGAGIGFQQKTLLYAAPDAEEARKTAHYVLNRQFSKTYKAGPGSSYPAPYCLKLTEYRDGYYSYGRCAIGFET